MFCFAILFLRCVVLLALLLKDMMGMRMRMRHDRTGLARQAGNAWMGFSAHLVIAKGKRNGTTQQMQGIGTRGYLSNKSTFPSLSLPVPFLVLQP
jgi:hypothetical protein